MAAQLRRTYRMTVRRGMFASGVMLLLLSSGLSTRQRAVVDYLKLN